MRGSRAGLSLLIYTMWPDVLPKKNLLQRVFSFILDKLIYFILELNNMINFSIKWKLGKKNPSSRWDLNPRPPVIWSDALTTYNCSFFYNLVCLIFSFHVYFLKISGMFRNVPDFIDVPYKLLLHSCCLELPLHHYL